MAARMLGDSWTASDEFEQPDDIRFVEDDRRPAHLGSFLNTGWFDGQIDDVRIYNRALSTNEVQQLYVEESGSAPRFTNIVNATVDLGRPATLSVAAVGGQPVSLQWYDRDNSLISGATNNSLTIPDASATNVGFYHVVASNAWGLASAAPRLTVNNPYTPYSCRFPGSCPAPSMSHSCPMAIWNR